MLDSLIYGFRAIGVVYLLISIVVFVIFAIDVPVSEERGVVSLCDSRPRRFIVFFMPARALSCWLMERVQ